MPPINATDVERQMASEEREKRLLSDQRISLNAEEIIDMWSYTDGDPQRFRGLFSLLYTMTTNQKTTIVNLGPTPRTDTAFNR